MKRKEGIEINNNILKKEIETLHLSVSEISKEIGISEETLNKIIEGKEKITIRQLEKLSCHLKRPIAFFLLSEIPEEKPLPKDRRMISGKEDIFSKETIFAIRITHRLQDISRELAENLGKDLKPLVPSLNTSYNPKKIAKEYREKFSFNENIQRKIKTPNKIFNFLRDAIENLNILVYQFSMPVEDVRGFTLSDGIPKVIVVNSKDQIEARIFTLIHEFGHILLNETVIDMPEDSLFLPNRIQGEKENWCYKFASEFLLPDSLAKEIFEKNKENLTETKTLNYLSKAWKVSKKFLLYKMLKLKFIDEKQRKKILSRPYKEKKMKGGPPPDVKCISEKGKKFISLVSANLDRDFITFAEALDYLSVKSHHYEKILSKIR